jgi:hypothetical protein
MINDKTITQYLPVDDLQQLMDITHYLGDAPERARTMAETIRKQLSI